MADAMAAFLVAIARSASACAAARSASTSRWASQTRQAMDPASVIASVNASAVT